MSQVWILMRIDYEEADVEGVYSTQAQAVHAQQALWGRYQGLTVDQRERAGPVGLRHEASLTWETFVRWHPVLVYAMDEGPVAYGAPASVAEDTP